MSTVSDLNLTRWSHNVIFFAIFLVTYGVLVCVNVGESGHKMHGFGCMLTFVGLVGIIAGICKKKLLVRLQMVLLVYLTVVTTHIVLSRLCEKREHCSEKATVVSAQHSTIYFETMPGLYVEIGSQVSYVMTVDPKVLNKCEEEIKALWMHMIVLLFTVLTSCLICSWRFIIAIDRCSKGYVPLTVVDKDDTVLVEDMVAVKEVPMPPPAPDAFQGTGVAVML